MVLRKITFTVPETILENENTSAEAFGNEIRLLAAVKLYELGRLSSGKAAELAGITKIEFLMNLEKYKVFPLTVELEELEREYAELDL